MSAPLRLALVDGDLPGIARLKAALELALHASVTVTDAHYLRATVAQFEPDVVVTGLAGMTLVPGVRTERPGTPVVVIAEGASLADAVQAVRLGVTEFLTEPPAPAELAAKLAEVAEAFRAASGSARRRQTVLVVGAHPDDAEAGVGGILAAHRAAGDDVTILTLSRGRRDGGLELARAEAEASAAVIGARLVLDDRMAGGVTAILQAASRVIAELDPTIVYTHSSHDRRQDHRLVHEAVVTAAEEVATVACFHGTTGTVDFAPTRFVPIDGYTETKLAMLRHFATRGERPDYLAPDFVLAAARYWSHYGPGSYCEPLEIIRESVLAPVGVAAIAPSGGHAHDTGAVAATSS
ncbi:PIG-L family deacetylase [Pseudolysinimonas sp.]